MSGGSKSEILHNNIFAVTDSLKKSSPMWDRFLKASVKYYNSLQEAQSSALDFFEAFAQLAGVASHAQGSTHDLGVGLMEMVESHREIERFRGNVMQSLGRDVIAPLKETIVNYSKDASALEKQYKAENKTYEQRVKAANKQADKMSKVASKGKQANATELLRDALTQVSDTVAELDEFRSNYLRRCLIEERRRFCFLLMHFGTVCKTEVDMYSSGSNILQEKLGNWLNLALSPDELPESRAELVEVKERTFIQLGDAADAPGGGGGGGGYGGGGGGYGGGGGGYGGGGGGGGYGGGGGGGYGGGGGGGYGGGGGGGYGGGGGGGYGGGGGSSTKQFEVLYDYTDDDPDNLNINAGEIIDWMGEEDDGWYKGQNQFGETGWFPASYVEECSSGAAPAPPPPQRSAPRPPPAAAPARGPPGPPAPPPAPPAPPPAPAGGGGGGKKKRGGGGGGGGRGALLSSIQQGTRLKKTQTNDRSAPRV